MKTVKSILVLFTVLITAGLSFGTQKESKAIIRQVSDDLITVTAEICDLDQMRVEITNDDGDVILSDHFTGDAGIARKTYDFSKTRVGGYYVTIYCNDEVMETTVVGNKKIKTLYSYYLVLN